MEDNNTMASEGTTLQEEPHAEQNVDTGAEGSPNPEGNDGATNGSENGAEVNSEGNTNGEGDNGQEDNFLSITFNHESRSLNREDAAKFAQLGLKYQSLLDGGYNPDELKDVHSQLDYLAAQKGVSIGDLVSGLLESEETLYRQGLEERFGDDKDTVEQLMKLHRNEQKEKYNQILSERKNAKEKTVQDTNERIAKEFSEVKENFPEYSEYSKLPDEVKAAALKGENLFNALLRFRHKEQVKVDAANKQQAAAAKAAAGNLDNPSAENRTPAEELFLRGLKGL